MTEHTESAMLKAVFDALPSLVFVVDQDVRILEYNAAASVLFLTEGNSVLKRRAGDVLHCLHSEDVVEGCGRAPFCSNCMIRNTVTEAFQGGRVVRRRARIELLRDAKAVEIYALITASPFLFQDRQLVLLNIEDINEIAELYRMISMCSLCGKVRNSKETWIRVEAYFKRNWDLDFSHGYCPDCLNKEMDRLERFVNPLQATSEESAVVDTVN
ncbi:MAG: hypothetical protein HXX11_07345 [Desulfuromonadales bacterium]|nr:hypothetical protein [Desulfuromonadales bacterium]